VLGDLRAAGFWPRLWAGVIDWTIVFVGVWLAAIVAAILGADEDGWVGRSWWSILFLPLLYFGLTWARSGQTLGLRAIDLRMISTSTWQTPPLARALLRALVAALTFTAFWVPPVAAFGDSSTAAVVTGVALTFVALAFIGHLWALVDRRGLSLQDRLFGLAVVRSISAAQASEAGSTASAPSASA
jgi:uncharacterized RDD family membrane protein YckC